MSDIKIYECKICKELSKKKLKGFNRFRGTRKDVRKHLVEIHGIKGKLRNPKWTGTKNKYFPSKITESTLSEVFK